MTAEWVETHDELKTIELKSGERVVLLVPLGVAAREAVSRWTELPVAEGLYLVVYMGPYPRGTFVMGASETADRQGREVSYLEQLIQASFGFDTPTTYALALGIDAALKRRRSEA